MKKTLVKKIILFNLFYFKNTEAFTCNRDLYYSPKLFRPFRMSFLNYDNHKNYIDTNLIVTKKNIEKLLNTIPITETKYKYIEKEANKYDYEKGFISYHYKISDINSIFNKTFTKIKKHFHKANKLHPKYCNNRCVLELIDKRVISLGSIDKILSIHGQLLLKFNVSNYIFLIEFISNFNDKIQIFMLKCSGIELLKYFIDEDSLDHISNTKIYGSPLYNKYDGDKTYIYSSTEIEKKNNNNKKLEPYDHLFRCYGKKSIDKYNCENSYDVNGKKLKSIGVWDRPCVSNEDCPFYKKNKNYDNEFGGCKEGVCEFPIGAINISPRKARNLDIMLCHNCLKKSNCCQEQFNKKLYPKLMSPDYAFKNDHYLRTTFN